MRADATMTRSVVVIPPEVPLATAWGLMQTQRIRHLPVVRSGELLGILSDRDVLLHAQPGPDGEPIAPMTPVRDAMTPDPLTITADMPVGKVVRLFLEHKIDAAPVLATSGRLVGVVTTTDLLALLLDRDDGARMPFEWKLIDSAAAAGGSVA
jgi:acetoin utilization protein AcuB